MVTIYKCDESKRKKYQKVDDYVKEKIKFLNKKFIVPENNKNFKTLNELLLSNDYIPIFSNFININNHNVLKYFNDGIIFTKEYINNSINDYLLYKSLNLDFLFLVYILEARYNKPLSKDNLTTCSKIMLKIMNHNYINDKYIFDVWDKNINEWNTYDVNCSHLISYVQNNEYYLKYDAENSKLICYKNKKYYNTLHFMNNRDDIKATYFLKNDNEIQNIQ